MLLVVRRARHDHPPLQFFVLFVTFSELPGDLRAGEFEAEVERVRAVVLDRETGKQIVGIGRDVEPVTVVDADTVRGYLNAEIRVANSAGEFPDIRIVRERVAFVQREQAFVDMPRRARVLARGKHDPSREIDFPNDGAAVTTHLGREQARHVQFRGQAEQQTVDAERVGVGQLAQIADSHHDVDRGVACAQRVIAHDRLAEAVMDRIEYRIGVERAVAGEELIDGREQ